jgi:hypothetical protein
MIGNVELVKCVTIARGNPVEQKQIGFVARRRRQRKAGLALFVRHWYTFGRFTARLRRAARRGLPWRETAC